MTHWNYLKSGNIDIVYNGLSYGNYHLTVCVVNGEGKIGAEVYSQDISVLPPLVSYHLGKTVLHHGFDKVPYLLGGKLLFPS